MGLYLGELVLRRVFASVIWGDGGGGGGVWGGCLFSAGLIFGGDYYQNFMVFSLIFFRHRTNS